MAENPSRMIYLGGHSARKGVVGVLAFPADWAGDTEFTLFYTTDGSQWGQKPFDFDIVSVTYLADPARAYKGWWLIGKRGEVVELAGGESSFERIAGAGAGTGSTGRYGYLSRIRAIGGALFVCGRRRQVYRRDPDGWRLISADILDSRPEGPWNGFEAIDGFAEDDLYAVGGRGEIWHFDGRDWSRCDSPTNVMLADVRCIDGRVWACGDAGIILCGDKDRWDLIWADTQPSENWWSLERFGDSLYVAGNDLLGRLENDQVVPVDLGAGKSPTTHVLHSRDGVLWSIGKSHVLAFDGVAWVEHVCPENRGKDADSS